MSIENNVSRITLGRDIKLHKWGIILFILVSFASLISLLWATDISLNLPFLYAIYIIVTLYVLRFAKVDIFSPLMFFIFFSFLGFGLQLPILSIVPNSVFFINPFYHPNFEYSNYALAFAFYVFLIGYIGFIVGFNMVKRSVKLTVSERLVHPLGIAIVAVILIIASFYFRSLYHVGVPGYYSGSIQHAGYIYYPLMYGSLIATSLALYSAIIRNSVFYTMLGVLLFCLYALLVPPERPEEIAACLQKLLNDEKLWERLSINGRKFVEENIRWDLYGKKVLQLFSEVLSNCSGSEKCEVSIT